ncbi:hypothetical protein IZS58_003688 [Vibrio parahaemolyticus]|nr:hypothetical protein [Vibrio parahaemolyticus]EJI1377194.1 hypothetical protein [Vibrio parahaemolyticus]
METVDRNVFTLIVTKAEFLVFHIKHHAITHTALEQFASLAVFPKLRRDTYFNSVRWVGRDETQLAVLLLFAVTVCFGFLKIEMTVIDTSPREINASCRAGLRPPNTTH